MPGEGGEFTRDSSREMEGGAGYAHGQSVCQHIRASSNGDCGLDSIMRGGSVCL